MNELLKWREEFPILEKTTYLINNSLGAMPRGVYERMLDYAETWATRGWQVNSPANSGERGGTVSVECPHAAEVMRELLARDILVDYRPKAGIRLSPHFYNRDEEIDFALAQMEEILATRTWEPHLQAV